MSFNINNRLNGINTLAYLGANAVQPPNFVTDNRPPNSGDSKNLAIGTLWLDLSGYPNTLPTAANIYMLVALVGNVATWVDFAGGGALLTLAGNSGGPISGDASHNINIVTANSTPKIVGSGNTLTLDFSLSALALGSSMPSLTTGTKDVSLGFQAGNATTSGTGNTLIGYQAGLRIANGSGNTFIGNGSGAFNVSGVSNVGVGTFTLATWSSVLGYNTIVGDSSWGNLISGNYNCSLGSSSAANYNGAESSNILIGNNILGTTGESNKLRIGNATGSGAGALNAAFICGIDGVGLNVAKVVTMASDQLGTASIQAGTGIVVTTAANTITIAASGTTSLTYTSVNFAASPYTVLSTDEYISVNTSGGPVTLRFPNAATLSRAYIVKDRTGNAAANNITVTTVGGAVNIDGAVTFVMNTAFQAINIIGNASTYEVY